MITQTIKRWLDKMFAWWPWRRAPQSAYPQAVTNANTGSAQDSLWHPSASGPLPQPGIMSVAVEQEKDDAIPKSGWSPPEDRSERLAPLSQPITGQSTDKMHPSKVNPSKEALSAPDEVATPTFEQHLAFLHYLVKRGIVNEGFTRDQIPKQYRRKYE
jgi:hypothetical protein